MSAVRVTRPSILGQVPGAGHVVIEASAGTGKTYTLEHLVVDLLLSTDTSIGRLLVVTFTDKGARELRSRVRSTIQGLLDGGGPRDPEPDPGCCWTIDEAARRRLRRALDEFDEASISTIHSFCHRVLTEFSFDTRRPFEGEQVDGRRAFERTFTVCLRETLGGEVLRHGELEFVPDTRTVQRACRSTAWFGSTPSR